jgi:hypothetical protein
LQRQRPLPASRLFGDHCETASCSITPRKRDFFQGNGVRLYRIGTEHEYDRVCPYDQVLHPLPPFLEGVDVSAVDQWLEAASPERCVEAISEG